MSQMPVSADVIGRIRRYRLARNMSAQALADAITAAGFHIQRAQIAKLETGKAHTAPVDLVAAAAKVFSLPIAAMFHGEPCPTCAGKPADGFTCNTCGSGSPTA